MGYQYIKKILQESPEHQPRWRYRGQGYGHGILHSIGLLEPHEVVTCSQTHGWLGSCEDFIKQFEVVLV